MTVTLESAFEAIIGIIILSGLVAFGIPIAVGFLVNATGLPVGISALVTSLAPFIAAIIGVYLLFAYAMSAMHKA
jgi:drug/metabolite transporter (DMT)-like permease